MLAIITWSRVGAFPLRPVCDMQSGRTNLHLPGGKSKFLDLPRRYEPSGAPKVKFLAGILKRLAQQRPTHSVQSNERQRRVLSRRR